MREEWYAKGKRRKTDADDEEFEMDVKKLTHKTIIEMEFRAQRAGNPHYFLCAVPFITHIS